MRSGFEKRFQNGDIVYWCHSDGCGKYSVKYGMVDEQFSDAVAIAYLVPRGRIILIIFLSVLIKFMTIISMPNMRLIQILQSSRDN